ncbi:hypothetical protein ScPMuIL_015941 [Solemya velum]
MIPPRAKHFASQRTTIKMDIKYYLPCKKTRRSYRLEVKEKEEHKFKTIRRGPLGYFDILPLELKFLILKYLRIEDLSILTIASKSMRNLIEGFRVTHPIVQKNLLHELHDTKNDCKPRTIESQQKHIQLFQKLGLLLKRSTCLYATRDRLKFINEFLTKMLCWNTEKCRNRSHCIALICFGKFFLTVIAGWDDTECEKAFDAICQHTCVLKNVKLVVTAKSGTHLKVEYDIRVFFRRIFLDQCNSVQERSFWLSCVLRPWPIFHQARLLFLLYGPALDDEILWFEHCENTPENAEQSTQHFGELANAVQILHCYPQEWSEDDIISVLDEITSYPDEWLAENVAHLLILCGDSITTKLLVSKAINGRMVELASITTSFCLVCVKNDFSLSYVVMMMQKILEAMDSNKDRLNFCNSFTEMFREVIMDSHEFGDNDQGHENDMFFMVTALSEFTKKMFQMAFKSILS